MMNTNHLLFALALAGVFLWGGAAGLCADDGVPRGRGHLIRVELTEPPGDIPASIRQLAQPKTGPSSYQVFLPKDYDAEPERRYPALFIMSAGGNVKFPEDLQSRANRDGWILIGFQEARNGPWEPIITNIFSAHDDAVARFRIQEGLKFATGFSGGSRGTSLLVQGRPGFAGHIAHGAGFAFNSSNRYVVDGLSSRRDFAVMILIGDKDDNFSEVARLTAALPKGVEVRSETFPGGHVLAPAAVFHQALDWHLMRVYMRTQDKQQREELVRHLAPMLDRIREEPSARVRIKRMDEMLSELEKSRSGPKEFLDQLRSTRVQLQQDPELVRELAAEAAWERIARKIETLESQIERARDDRRKSRAHEEMADLLEEFAKSHEGTSAAANAAKQAAAHRSKIVP